MKKDADPVVVLLKTIKRIPAEYPPELLEERRRTFLEQIDQQPKVAGSEQLKEKVVFSAVASNASSR